MFASLPHSFRAHGLQTDVRVLLHLYKALDKGLVHTIGDLYVVLKALITNDPTEFGPFTAAFYEYFLDIPINQGERLESAVLRSPVFQDWKKEFIKEEEKREGLFDYVNQFLDEIHKTSLDIKNIISGEDILKNDDPNRPDNNPQDDQASTEPLNKMADYSQISLEELLQRMKQVAAQQNGKHFGGNHWIGQGGISPYGNGGAAQGGIRVGGGGGGKMARAVMNDRRFFPADVNAILKDDNIDAALAILKGIEDETAEVMLNIPVTITEGIKEGGIFLPHVKEKINHKVQVILMIDNGGLSMSPYVRSVQKLFSKMKTRFTHDLKTYYYHNTIYGGAYSNAARSQFVPIERIIGEDKNYAVFIIGDADMAPYELSSNSLESWEKLLTAYKRIAWLNPTSERYWASSMTISLLKRKFPMYPLSPSGIEKAIQYMNRKRKYNKL